MSEDAGSRPTNDVHVPSISQLTSTVTVLPSTYCPEAGGEDSFLPYPYHYHTSDVQRSWFAFYSFPESSLHKRCGYTCGSKHLSLISHQQHIPDVPLSRKHVFPFHIQILTSLALQRLQAYHPIQTDHRAIPFYSHSVLRLPPSSGLSPTSQRRWLRCWLVH